MAEDTQSHRRQVWDQRPVLFQLPEVAFEVQHFLVHRDLQLHHNPSVNRGRKEHPPIHRTGISHGGGKFSTSRAWHSPPRRPRDTPGRPLVQTSRSSWESADGESGRLKNVVLSRSAQKELLDNAVEFLSPKMTDSVVQNPLLRALADAYLRVHADPFLFLDKR